MTGLQDLVDAADTAALLRAVDGLCASRQWDTLTDLGRRCLDAVELGKQLWPVATHIDYRLALEAPPAHAAAVVRTGAGRFALGPLTEVAAGSHDWAALSPHLPEAAAAAAVAQERVLRGEDLTAAATAGGAAGAGMALAAGDMPLRLAAWEPAYALPRYRDREAAFPQPEASVRPLGGPRTLSPAAEGEDDDAARALRGTVETWVAESSGRVATAAVRGSGAAAVGRLLLDTGRQPSAAFAALGADEALAVLQWAGASGGAYGRRRGGAAGRFSAWWAATAVAGLDWPPDPWELGEAVGELDWYRWSPPGAETGWVLRLAVADPLDGLAWAVEAVDQRDDEVPPAG